MPVWHFVRFYVIILEIFTVIRPMLLCVEIGNFPFQKQLSVVILLDFSAERERQRERERETLFRFKAQIKSFCFLYSMAIKHARRSHIRSRGVERTCFI